MIVNEMLLDEFQDAKWLHSRKQWKEVSVAQICVAGDGLDHLGSTYIYSRDILFPFFQSTYSG